MLRTVIAVAAIAVGVTVVAAQSDPIAARKALMKNMGAATKTGGGMAKGEVPYDQAKAQEIFATYIDVSAKMPALFPDNSKTGGETTASPKIWEDKAGFQKAFDEDVERRQGGAIVREGPRQLQGRVRRIDQELRRLPRDLSRQEELTLLSAGIAKGGPCAALRLFGLRRAA